MPTQRTGFTTLEQLIVLSLLSALSLITLASGAPLLEAAAVETATRDATALFALARDHALSSGERTAVRIDTHAQRLIVHVGGDTLATTHMEARGVRLEATRDSMAYAPSGLGVGAANLRLVLARGQRADTITVSRLGRVQVH
jgi:Tfp pilus assembly protein FimT